jgi:hypothetical protein
LQHRVRHGLELRVAKRQQPHADAAKAVERAAQQRGDELRVLHLAAHRGAVFVVQRYVEHRAQLGLQLQALAHARLHAGVVVARRQQRRGGVFGVEQGLAGVHRGWSGGGRRRWGS